MGVQCVDEQALVERSSGNPLRIAVWATDALLTWKAYGLMPEPYTVTVDGVKLDGVFLGAAGKVRWAFKQETHNNIVVWRPRFLLNGDALQEGEFAGYLAAKSG